MGAKKMNHDIKPGLRLTNEIKENQSSLCRLLVMVNLVTILIRVVRAEDVRRM